jgi:hypothetical protein
VARRFDRVCDVLTELGTQEFVVSKASDFAGNERLLRRVFGYPKAAPAKPVQPAAAPVKK